MIHFNTGVYLSKHNCVTAQTAKHVVPNGIHTSMCSISIRGKFYKLEKQRSTLKLNDDSFTIDQILAMDEKFCPKCIAKLKSIRLNKLSAFEYWLRPSSFSKKPDLEKWQFTICPNCKTHVMFLNLKHKQEHYCTVCKTNVILPMEAVI
jgi:uncharacterized paraquat-inducible protein A